MAELGTTKEGAPRLREASRRRDDDYVRRTIIVGADLDLRIIEQKKALKLSYGGLIEVAVKAWLASNAQRSTVA